MKLSIENGKYTIEFNEETAELKLMRGDEVWDAEPQYAKMFIALIYEVSDMKEILIKHGRDNPFADMFFSRAVRVHEAKYGKLR